VSDADQLRRLLLERSVRRGDFVLASGQRSSYYIDCRLTTMSAEGQVLIGRLGLAAVRAAIAAASWGTDTIIDAFSVRKEAKGHGMGQLIEGNFHAGEAVVVVEDVITSGGSAIKAIAAVEKAGAQVLGVLAVVDREQGGRERIAEAGHKVVSLTTTSALGLAQARNVSTQ